MIFGEIPDLTPSGGHSPCTAPRPWRRRCACLTTSRECRAVRTVAPAGKEVKPTALDRRRRLVEKECNSPRVRHCHSQTFSAGVPYLVQFFPETGLCARSPGWRAEQNIPAREDFQSCKEREKDSRWLNCWW